MKEERGDKIRAEQIGKQSEEKQDGDGDDNDEKEEGEERGGRGGTKSRPRSSRRRGHRDWSQEPKSDRNPYCKSLA